MTEVQEGTRTKVAGSPVTRRGRKPNGAAGRPRIAKPSTKTKEKPAKEVRPCACGCGGQTTAWFVPGHDARFKGWLLKIERGEKPKEELLSKAVINRFKWAKVKGGGERPTTNYKGEPHQGYLNL